MSTAQLSPIRLHVAIRRVAREAQGVYSLGFRYDLAKQYAEKLTRHLRRLRGISDVKIVQVLGSKHADAVRWARSICIEWHRINELGWSNENWMFMRLLLPMPDRLQESLQDELAAAIVTTPTTATQQSEGENPPPPSTSASPTETQQGEGGTPDAQSAKQLLHGWRAIDEALGLSRSYSNMNYNERRRKLAYLNRRYGGPIKIGGKGSQPIVNLFELIAWWNSLETQVEDAKARIRDRQATLQNRHQYGRTAEVTPDLGGSVKRRKSRSQT